jgi:hypothetical protein
MISCRGHVERSDPFPIQRQGETRKNEQKHFRTILLADLKPRWRRNRPLDANLRRAGVFAALDDAAKKKFRLAANVATLRNAERARGRKILAELSLGQCAQP